MITVKAVDFPEIETGWRALEEQGHVPTVFQTYDWNRIWWKYLGGKRKKNLLAVYKDDLLIGIAPLYTERMTLKGVPFFSILRFIGTPESDYTAFIFRKGEERDALSAITAALKIIQWDIAWLSDIADGDTIRGLYEEAIEAGRFFWITKQHTPCPGIALPEAWAEYKATLATSMRRNSNNYSNKLSKAGVVEIASIKNPEEIPSAMRDFFRLHNGRWNNQSKAITNKNIESFHNEVALALSRYLDLCFVSLNGKKIGCTYSYDFRGQRFFYLPGADMAYKEYRLGTLMILNRIQDAIEKKMTFFDFMRGDEEYKMHFTKNIHHNWAVYFAKQKWKFKLFCKLENLH
jgi:CelD/BcsL family acetyltransferase involved in cellulose biosynthesis